MSFCSKKKQIKWFSKCTFSIKGDKFVWFSYISFECTYLETTLVILKKNVSIKYFFDTRFLRKQNEQVSFPSNAKGSNKFCFNYLHVNSKKYANSNSFYADFCFYAEHDL